MDLEREIKGRNKGNSQITLKPIMKMKNIVNLFLIIVIFFPTGYFHLFFIIIPLLIFIIAVVYGAIFGKIRCKLNPNLVLFLSYLLLGSTIRFFQFNFVDLRDYIEIFRFLPLLLIITFKHIIKLWDFEFLLKTLRIYIILDFIVSLFQFFYVNQSILNFIERLYCSPHHLETSLLISRRSLGLSSYPGEHGLTILVMIAIIFFNLLKNKNKEVSLKYIVRDILIISLGYFSILLSQSQTAVIGIFVLNILIFFFVLRKLKNINKRALTLYVLLLIILILPLTYFFLSDFRYLISLFEYGLSRSSYQKRVLKWNYLIDKASNYPLGLIIGWGKSFWGVYSTAMDNEHLYILLCYGPLIYFLILWNIYLLYKRRCKNPFYKDLFVLLILIGLPLAWPNAYFLIPKVYLILSLIFVKLNTLEKCRFKQSIGGCNETHAVS